MADADCWMGRGLRPTRMTLAPAWAKPSAMAEPMPVPPPVMRAVRLVKSKSALGEDDDDGDEEEEGGRQEDMLR